MRIWIVTAELSGEYILHSVTRYIRDFPERRAATKVCKKLSPAKFALDRVKKMVFVEDTDLLTSLSLLRSIIGSDTVNEAAALLGNVLTVDEQTLENKIRIGDISAITVSKGRYVGNLCRLKYTINTRGTYPMSLPEDKQQEMWNQVKKEFSQEADGSFVIDREEWSGRLIARNTGAARRFCWARYHNPDRVLRCRIINWRLESEMIETLNKKYWLCILPEDIYIRISDLDPAIIDYGWVQYLEHVASFHHDNSRDSWSFCAVKRDSMFFPTLRDSLLDAAIPVHDISSWLMQLQAGRGTP